MADVRLTCIRCPRGCALVASVVNGDVVDVAGNACRRGIEYARAEVTRPLRTVTTTVPVEGSPCQRVVSVRTAGEVPRDRVLDVMRALAGACAHAPIEIGDVVLADVAGTGVNVVATARAEAEG